MSKIIFMKYLPAARGKLTPKLKLLRNSCLIFQVFRSQLRYMIKVSLNICNILVMPKLVPEFEFQSRL